MFSNKSFSSRRSDSHHSNQPQKGANVNLNQILHAILRKSKRAILELNNPNSNSRNKKISLMSTIFGMRIIFARYLALYRWNLIHQSKSVSPSTLSRQAQNQQMISSALQSLERVFKDRTMKHIDQKILFQKRALPPQQLMKTKIYKLDVFSCIVNNSKYSKDIFITFICPNIIKVSKPPEYQFQIRIRSNGLLSLTSFSFACPKKSKLSISPRFCLIFSILIEKSKKPIEEAQNVLHKLYVYGQYLRIIQQITSFQDLFALSFIENNQKTQNIFHKDHQSHQYYHSAFNNNSFNNNYCNSYNNNCFQNDYHTLNQKNHENSSNLNSNSLFNDNSLFIIKFPHTFAPSNTFHLKMTDSGVNLSSENVLLDGFYSKNVMNLNNIEIESIFHEIHKKVIQTKLHHLWDRISQGIKSIHSPDFKGELTKNSICLNLYEQEVCEFFIDPISGKTFVKSCNDQAKDYEPLIPFLEMSDVYLVAVRILYFHAISSILFNCNHHIQTNLLEQDNLYKDFVQLINFSSAPTVNARCLNQEGRPFFVIDKLEAENIHMAAGMITTINYLTPIRKTANTIKINTLFVQFAQALRTRGIPTFLGKMRIRFVLDPFDSIVLKISDSFAWSIKFINPENSPQKTIIFNGNKITARFAEWLVFFVANVSTLLQMRRQIAGIYSTNSIIDHLDIIDIATFLISFKYKDKIKDSSTLRVSLEPLFSLQYACEDVLIYDVHPELTPTIQFSFSQNIPMKRHLASLLKSGSICFLFGSFLSSSFIPLLYFHRVFMQGENSKNWSVTALRDDGSFFLIYQRKMSINFMLRPSQIFQLIIPSVGKSKVLQIPLEALPRPCHLSKLSHTTLKIHIDQLDNFRHVVERFFGFREKLHEIGFETFRSNGAEVVSPFPRQLTYVSIDCYIRPTHVEFKIEGEVDVAKNLDTILNFQYKDTDTHIMIIRFIINILDFDQKFVTFIANFMKKMINRTNELNIDWKMTMELSAVTLSELKVIFNFATNTGQFCVELTKTSKDSAPDILCYDKNGATTHPKSKKELGNWIRSMDHSESE
ncbi:hypothetical protein TRFO_07434 [Tritrichomonas foetus]|uniref:Uncharacterized protein n=1 Tax=Tritrichomonas foetus TaxID=1144522 RepID=A0A1J4JWF3_9EUKA|nr:hypothetical protein TRFO_07434 [Tritrichomonas foetus]|eukprot:OHT01854.1 hypothetical protein TRFO_07434 [Tritrichomonas foetus]